MVITPPHMHISSEVSFKAGQLAMSTRGDPRIQGDTVPGMQGIGVRTPAAAVVALTTAGFVGLEHMPNGGMFTIGMLSMILAAYMKPVETLFKGVTKSMLGANPKVHCSTAPLQTCFAIFLSLQRLSLYSDAYLCVILSWLKTQWVNLVNTPLNSGLPNH